MNLAVKKYGRSWNGLVAYVNKEIKEQAHDRAIAVLRDAARKHARLLRRGLTGVPLLRVWKALVGRDFDHGISIDKWSTKEYAWEKKTPRTA